MRKLLVAFLIICLVSTGVRAAEFTAPPVPEEASDMMPGQGDSFGRSVWLMLAKAVRAVRPELADAAGLCLSVLALSLMLSLLQPLSGSGKRAAQIVCTFGISAVLLQPASSMIRLGTEVIGRLADYSKLLLPVMTGALAAQGGVTKSAALYAGTAMLNAGVTAVNASVVVPLIEMYLVLSIVNSLLGDQGLKRVRDLLKTLAGWVLKTTITLFTGYMGLTGIIQGSADASALKAAKITLAGMIPVVGGPLSDAAETVLLSAGIVKNAAGIYGMLAILAIVIRPFLEIAVPYLLLKLTAGVSGVFATPQASELIQDFISAMGLLLAVIGTICLLLLISTACFMKGVS